MTHLRIREINIVFKNKAQGEFVAGSLCGETREKQLGFCLVKGIVLVMLSWSCKTDTVM